MKTCSCNDAGVQFPSGIKDSVKHLPVKGLHPGKTQKPLNILALPRGFLISMYKVYWKINMVICG